MSNCEYVAETYGVPACIGRRIRFQGREGVIAKDRGNYIGVTFDDDKPGIVHNLHPTFDVEYLGIGEAPNMTRSQQRYQDYLASAHYDAGDSFATYLGIEG